MAEEILSRFQRQVESLRLAPSSGGRFEVSVDGASIFSKIQTGRFPEPQEVIRAVESHLREVAPREGPQARAGWV